jgi:hypothetical protein
VNAERKKMFLRGFFADVYSFISQAMNGDSAAADAVFENYLDGRPEELLSLSRDRVSADEKSPTVGRGF